MHLPHRVQLTECFDANGGVGWEGSCHDVVSSSSKHISVSLIKRRALRCIEIACLLKTFLRVGWWLWDCIRYHPPLVLYAQPWVPCQSSDFQLLKTLQDALPTLKHGLWTFAWIPRQFYSPGIVGTWRFKSMLCFLLLLYVCHHYVSEAPNCWLMHSHILKHNIWNLNGDLIVHFTPAKSWSQYVAVFVIMFTYRVLCHIYVWHQQYIGMNI